MSQQQFSVLKLLFQKQNTRLVEVFFFFFFFMYEIRYSKYIIQTLILESPHISFQVANNCSMAQP